MVDGRLVPGRRRNTGRARARSGPSRSRPPWLRAVDSLVDPRAETALSHVQREFEEIAGAIEHYAAHLIGDAARRADEQAVTLTGRARPLPKRNRTMPEHDPSTPADHFHRAGLAGPPPRKLVRQRHAELAESLIVDPHLWAEAFKAQWSCGASVDQMTGWFRDAMAAALAADALDRGRDPHRFPHRYVEPEQARHLQDAAKFSWECAGSYTTPTSIASIDGVRCGMCPECRKPFALTDDDDPTLIGHARPDVPASAYDNGAAPESYGIDSPDGRG